MNLEDVPAARPCKKNDTSSEQSAMDSFKFKKTIRTKRDLEIVGCITMLSQDCKAPESWIKAIRRLPIKRKRPLDCLVFTGLANQMEVADKEVKVKAGQSNTYVHSLGE